MRVYKQIAFLIACFLFCRDVVGQDYLQFIENKGQWDASVRFKGDMSNGAFLLQKNGYRVLMHNADDLNRLAIAFHGHHNVASAGASGKNPKAQTKSALLNTAGSSLASLRSHIYGVRFLNANENPVIVPEKPLATYTNYFIGNDSTKWATNCKTYQAITYKDVYPNIDVRYYTSNGVLKYDFIVRPGGDVSAIAMYFDGADGLKMKEGSLVVKTSVDEVKELPPYTYQLLDDKRTEIPCSYDLKSNIVRFRLDGAYSKTATLVIDPSLVFSTFTGSTADNWGYTATYDGGGNFYAGGIVFNSGGGTKFPVSNGAFQQSFQGGTGATGEGAFDMAIIKFDPSGANRLYATYLGGTGNEQPHSLVVDPAGDLVIAGSSTSVDYPTAGAVKNYGSLTGNSWHIVVTKLNPTGTGLVGSVRVGGNGLDGVNIRHKYTTPYVGAESTDRNYGDDARSEVILDGSGNIYVASCTQSSDFPTTAISAQTKLGGTNAAGRAQDAVVIKLAPDLSSVLFSVLFGGSDDDAAFVLAISPLTNDVFVGGVTASNDFPGNMTGSLYSSFQGGITDGFVVEFTSNGAMVKSGYFGTSGNDLIYGIQFDKFGYPYIAGTTTGAWPISNAPFSQTGGKQFISKLQKDLSGYVYSTVFGTNSASPNLSLTAFLVDRCENVYVSGWGGPGGEESNFVPQPFPNSGTLGLTVTPDAYQSTTDNNDFYFFVLEKNAKSQLYGSFFGQVGGYGDHVDGGTSRFDRNGVIYQAMCANCSSPKPHFPTTPGVWAPNNGSGGCNLAAIKIAFNLAGIAAGIQASANGKLRDTAGCVPMNVSFVDTIAQGQKYIWDFNDGTAPVTSGSPTISHTYNTIGFYRVMEIAIDSNSCNIADTAYVNLRVRNDIANLAFVPTKLPPCASLTYQFVNNSTAIKPFTNQSFRWDFGDGTTQTTGTATVFHNYASPGTYNVKMVLVDTNFCNAPDSIVQTISIASIVKAQFVIPPFGCAPFTLSINNTSIAGQQFIWYFSDGTIDSVNKNPVHVFKNPGVYTIKLVANDSSTCNKADSITYSITVSNKPQSAFNYSPQPTVTNKPVIFQNASSGGTNYKWVFGDGDTLVTTRSDTAISHLYNSTGSFNTCLITFNAAGCTDTSCQTIPAVIIPEAAVPNAFSPNGDGINDRIFVHGFGIAKMTWRIYNRWGAIVFVGNSITDGWDGTYKGKMLSQDVYHYTLEVEFASHDKASIKGDITLLR